MIPAYNEEKALPKLFERLNLLAKNTSKYDFEFIFINDGSKDKTMEIIRSESQKDSRISYINLSRNFGKENAMLAGFDYAKGDALVIIDADLQDPPELIPAMINLWEEGFDDVMLNVNLVRVKLGLKSKLRNGSTVYLIKFHKLKFNATLAIFDFSTAVQSKP